ncbi:MAG: aldehyde dehydrogenase family protein, partial [Actinobacteria bacterium]|nr:aldehyde dehydrogenase family protein [Actinomycetota bacterium]
MASKKTSSNGSPQTLKSFNPRTGETMREIPAIAPAEVREVVDQARKVAPEWGAIDPEGRAHLLREVRVNLKKKADEIVEVVAAETGKPPAEARAHEVLTPMLQLAYLEH